MNPVIIFARSPDHNGAWGTFEHFAIASDGQVLPPHSKNAAVIILPDDIKAEDMDLEFSQDEPVFGVEHEGKRLTESQRMQMKKWPKYQRVAGFHHTDGRYFYERLKMLLGPASAQDQRKIAVADVVSRCSSETEWRVITEFAMIQQIKLLDPSADTAAFEATIKAVTGGKKMFDDLDIGYSPAEIINSNVERLHGAACAG